MVALRFYHRTVLGLCLAAALAACGGGGGGGASPPPPAVAPAPGGGSATDSCGVEGQKQFARDVANDWYLWYDEMANVNPTDYGSVNAYLNALTAPLAVDGRDPGFSFMTTIAEDEGSFTTGAFVGFGFRFEINDAGDFYIADALEGGPGAEAGFRRGVEVLAIDTGDGFESVDDLVARNATTTELFGPSAAGVERGFRLRDGDQIYEVVITKRALDTPPLADAPRLLSRAGNTPVGYFHMRGFTTSANEPLSEVINDLATQGVTDLVIDLRYNGGGLLSVAENMLNLLGGDIADGQVAYRLTHNDKRRDQDEESLFAVRDDGITPLRIAFITTESTASASELVINSLAPHIELVLVGADTLGKAVGQYAFDQPGCQNRLRLIGFEIVNGESQGGFYTGLADSGRFTLCPAEDDVTRPFGDPEEDSLQVALEWLNAGVCGARATTSASIRSLSRAGDAAAVNRARQLWYPTRTLPDRRSPLWQ